MTPSHDSPSPEFQPSESAPQTYASPVDLTGRQLGDYRLLRRLGVGGMAQVYLAEQKSLNRRVALKVLRSELAADESFVRRFRNEAQAAAALVHANIVQIYEVGCIDGIHFIAQEYVAGQTLRQLLRRGALDLPTAVQIMRQVGMALQKAAGQGIVHRDIKPENILLGSENTVKVADFGLARFDDQRRSLELTEVGVTMGTPLYMSPEQVEGEKLDQRSDAYSFGVTSYHMLAGRPPFEGETALSVAVQHLKSEPRPLAEIRADIPASLCRIIHRLMAKNVEDRYASMRDMLNDLRAVPVDGLVDDWSAGGELWEVPRDPTLPVARFAETQRLSQAMQTSKSSRRQRRRTRWWIAAVALLVGALVAWSTRPRDPLAPDPSDNRFRVEKKASAAEQYAHALLVNDDRALQAVYRYFPPESLGPGNDRYYALLAKKEMALRFIDNREYDRAMELLEELTGVDDTEAEFQAFAFAGQAIVYRALGMQEEALRSLTKARSMESHLDVSMRRRLNTVMAGRRR